MTDLRKLLDEATPGPWVYPAQKWARDACIEASGDAVACPGTGGAMSYSQDICTMTWRGTPEWDANARLIALTPQLAAALIKAEEALASIAANTCCDGCQEAALVARAALSEIRALTGGNDD
jgi:hypothetical protein